jgi:FlaA1/EpsC-like NDP-sugar epimerase
MDFGGGRRSDPARLGGTHRIAAWIARYRGDLLLAVGDAAIVTVSFGVVLLLRLEGQVGDDYQPQFQRFLPLAVLVVLVANWSWGLYGQMWRHASVLEARRVVLAGASSGAVLVVVVTLLTHPRLMPLSVVVLGIGLCTMLVGLVRFRARLVGFSRRTDPGAAVTRVVVLGAGESAAALVRDMQRTPDGGLVPVAILDDDPVLRGRRCAGVRVLGPISELPRVAAEVDADQVVLAIASAPQSLVQRAADLADEAGLPLRVVPSVRELVDGQVGVRDIRDLEIDDLLGRQQVSTDLAAVAGLIESKRVLVTGAGGSIGSEIARQLSMLAPAQLLLLDHDETHLYDAVATLDGRAVQLLADVRDTDLLERLFQRHRPQIVFHAAAHKHVPLLEQHPAEAVRTNVCGTRNLVRMATRYGVERFVFISTDKAVRPSSVMGASKRVGERLVLEANTPELRFCAVRFGNVLGSRGSVIPTFMRQIRAGGPVTVTDKAATRYFMSIPEAVQLVLQAAALADGGEIFMLEMGEPVRIYDLARRMIGLAGRRVDRDVAIHVTGMRAGEKLHEELRRPAEVVSATSHPSVMRLRPEKATPGELARDVEDLVAAAAADDEDAIRGLLFRLAAGELPEPSVPSVPSVPSASGANGRSAPVFIPERRV